MKFNCIILERLRYWYWKNSEKTRRYPKYSKYAFLGKYVFPAGDNVGNARGLILKEYFSSFWRKSIFRTNPYIMIFYFNCNKRRHIIQLCSFFEASIPWSRKRRNRKLKSERETTVKLGTGSFEVQRPKYWRQFCFETLVQPRITIYPN